MTRAELAALLADAVHELANALVPAEIALQSFDGPKAARVRHGVARALAVQEKLKAALRVADGSASTTRAVEPP